ncbi:hypothetical protein [Kushneria aurantia]|uniref:Uncharacterized protein n=1 Tax=Kushneria aurantia TaxID=504092 RepID=A0ABV6G0V8_9GAMM|nr:hypothetical protein [Kushneria aurantia]
MFTDDGGKKASQAYWNALGKLKEMWLEVFDEDIGFEKQATAKRCYEQAIETVSEKLRKNPYNENKFKTYTNITDPGDPEILDKELRLAPDIDDLSPNLLLGIMLEKMDDLECSGMEKIELRHFLREVLDEAFEDRGTRRPNVGANRHWPRLRQYLREIEEMCTGNPQTERSQIMRNTYGGRIALLPKDPGRLTLKVNSI